MYDVNPIAPFDHEPVLEQREQRSKLARVVQRDEDMSKSSDSLAAASC